MLCCDNEGAISLTKDVSLHLQLKHIDVAHHFISEHIDADEIAFIHIPTHRMPADALTKLVTKPKLGRFRRIMGVYGKPLTTC